MKEKNKKNKFSEFNKSKKGIFIISIFTLAIILTSSLVFYFKYKTKAERNEIKNFQSLNEYITEYRTKFDSFKSSPNNRWEEEKQEYNDKKLYVSYDVNFLIGKSIYFNNKKVTADKNKLNLLITLRILNQSSKEIKIDLKNFNVFLNPYVKDDKGFSNKQQKNDNFQVTKEYKNDILILNDKETVEIAILVKNINNDRKNIVYIDFDRSFSKLPPIQSRIEISKKGIKKIYDR